MQLTRKQTLVGAAVIVAVAGGSYGAYTYISGLPKRLSKEEAAKRYLEIVCPGNALNPELISVSNEGESMSKQMEEIRARTYYGDEALSAAQARHDALEKKSETLYEKYRILLKKKAEQEKVQARMFLDPEYVWPEEVKESVKKVAEVSMERAAEIRAEIEGNSSEDNDEDGDEVFTAIRVKLGLEERGTGCPKEKKAKAI